MKRWQARLRIERDRLSRQNKPDNEKCQEYEGKVKEFQKKINEKEVKFRNLE